VDAISVIIPAHDEAAVIGRLLDGLAPLVASHTAEVIVVANGCTDETAAIADRPGVTVVEIEQGHKPSALNAGDAVARSFPRFYIDGDVVVSAGDLEAMARRLEEPGVEAVAPRLSLDTSKSSWLVRSYHRFWRAQPDVEDSLAGRGCFGVSEVGRSRWAEFPDIIADDQYVNRHFTDSERVVESSVRSVVTAPSDLPSLVARKQRSHRGNVELAQRGMSGSTSNRRWLRVLREHPLRLIDLPAFLGVTVAVRLAARRQARSGPVVWGADRSSRALT
jgi:glycosyltransferase involved in cell wall biosynthesis